MIQKIDDNPEINPIDAPTPGQSLTEAPGQRTWETPPIQATPKEATNMILMQLQEPDTYRNTLDLMYSGLTIESIVKSLTFVSFMEGLITPDVAEIVNLYLFYYLLGMARKAGIRPRLFNTDDTTNVDMSEMMKSLKPEKYNQMVNATEDPQLSQEMAQSFRSMKAQELQTEPEEEMLPAAPEKKMPKEEIITERIE